MLARLSSRLTYANVVSTVCLFILLGGSAVAASHLSGKSIKPHSIPGNRLKNHTIIGKQVNLGALGTVPHAANADKLGGSAASEYRLHCPSGLQRAADICFEPTPRTADNWVTAVNTCARANRQLPTEGELALVLENTDAMQPLEWTSTLFLNGSDEWGTILYSDASRNVQSAEGTANGSLKYRCVTNATN